MELTKEPWTVQFEENLQPGRFRLIEVKEDVLKLLTSTDGEAARLWIRGEQQEEAVLCSATATYAMRDAELSNSLLLVTVDDAETSKVVTAHDSLPGAIELARIPPRVGKVRRLLSKSQYAGPDAEDGVLQQDLLDLGSLLSLVQASERELVAFLDECGALLVDGKYRLLAPSFREGLLSTLLASVARARCPIEHQFPVDDCIHELAQSYPDVARDVLGGFVRSLCSSSAEGISLSRDKVCRSVAELLFAKQAQWELDPFMTSWGTAVHPIFNVDTAVIAGMAIIEATALSTSILHFPAHELPLDPAGRLRELFVVRPRWQRVDLVPYVRPICESDAHMESVLLNHTRPFVDERGNNMYSARF